MYSVAALQKVVESVHAKRGMCPTGSVCKVLLLQP